MFNMICVYFKQKEVIPTKIYYNLSVNYNIDFIQRQ